MRRIASSMALAGLVLAGLATAQIGNPDISVIGDVRSFVTDDRQDPKHGNLQLNLESVELALQGYLNPYARADVFAAYTEEEGLVVEEAYATILRGLTGWPADQGRPLPGRLWQAQSASPPRLLVPRHAADPQRATSARKASSTSASTSTSSFPSATSSSRPPSTCSRVTTSGAGRRKSSAPPTSSIPGLPRPSASASSCRPATTPASSWGSTRFQGTLTAVPGARCACSAPTSSTAGRPTRTAPSRCRGSGSAPSGTLVDTGRNRWSARRPTVSTPSSTIALLSAGTRARWPSGLTVPTTPSVTTKRAGVFAGFQLMEETTMLRLLLRRTDGDAMEEPANEAILQLVFSLGPHTAHWF